jgi:SAM-dependent methyltransferase
VGIEQTLKRRLRHARLAILDVWDVLARRRPPMTPSRRLIEDVGGLDFRDVGEHLAQWAIELGGLQPHEHILDAGCGVGRLAVPLTSYLTRGDYVGFDVSRAAIAWCQRHISAARPNFSFTFADIRNEHYNPRGAIAPEQFRFPCASESIDLVFAASLFTHLTPAAANHYVAESARVLRSGGRAVISFFLLDHAVRARLGELQPRFVNFPEPYYAIAEADDPGAAVAYDIAAVEAALGRHGLEIARVERGAWSGQAKAMSFQDVIVAKKRRESSS